MLGATVTGVAFVAPSLVMVLVLAWLYLRYGGLQWMQAAFYGIGAAVIAVIARGALKLGSARLAGTRYSRQSCWRIPPWWSGLRASSCGSSC